MKKSEIMVSMPMTTFEELEQYKKKLQELQDELRSCFDTTAYDVGNETSINFDVKKALNLAKNTLSAKYSGININCNT